MTKLTKITIESDSLFILRGRPSPRASCSLCQADAEVIDLPEFIAFPRAEHESQPIASPFTFEV